MLDAYAGSGHHPYAKGARLYVQKMVEYESDPRFKETLASYDSEGNHVVRYSEHEWSGVWTDLCIEQKCMRSCKSQGGPSRGRMKNSESSHRLWFEMLDHLTELNSLLGEDDMEEETEDTTEANHKDLGPTRILRDSEAIKAIEKWFDNRQPFDEHRDKNELYAFSTGFFSNNEKDNVNPEKVVECGQKMNKSLDNKPYATTMEQKDKIVPLSHLRKAPVVDGVQISVDPLKLFNRLIAIVQRYDDQDHNSLRDALSYELTVVPLSLFNSKGMMRESGKSALGKCLKDLTNPLPRPVTTKKVIDGGMLLHLLKWHEKDTWGEVTNNYVDLAMSISRNIDPLTQKPTNDIRPEQITAIFDGINKSTKDHEHRRRCKHLSGNITVDKDLPHIIPREKFLDNPVNKNQLIGGVVDGMNEKGITAHQCRDDADTALVKAALDNACSGSVEVGFWYKGL